MDNRIRIETITALPNPQQTVWLAMHQDYSEDFVFDNKHKAPSESEAGELVVKHLLSGNRGHYGCLEHAQIVVGVGYFPHSTMQQLRTHRTGISFDVQSGRYTSKRIIDAVEGRRELEDVFYLRPVGFYNDRKGKKYFYSEYDRSHDLSLCQHMAVHYAKNIEKGMAEEHARSMLPFDFRQHFVMSANARTVMHLLDLRWKKDAQLEAQWFAELLFAQFHNWMPQVATWYKENRSGKARLAP